MVICKACEVGGQDLCSHEVEGLKLFMIVGGECVSELVNVCGVWECVSEVVYRCVRKVAERNVRGNV